MDKKERFRGSLLGLAIGDALGQPVEFMPINSFLKIKDFQVNGTWNLPAGYWTDDTSMALCLADSLIRSKGMNAKDQMETYRHWLRDGYLRSEPDFEDIGLATYNALSKYETTGEVYCGNPDPEMAGNGSLMRLAPVPLVFSYDPKLAIEFAEESSLTTHASPQCLQACRYMAGLICGVISGITREEIFTRGQSLPDTTKLHKDMATLLKTNFNTLKLSESHGGYVVESLKVALWGFANFDCFEDGLLAVVNLGGDTDTNGAIYGQLAGAYWGESGLPQHLLEGLYKKDMISEYADKLFELSIELATQK